MTDTAIQVEGVWKKFQKGELHDSLRELIPSIAKRVVRRGPRRDQLEKREFWALRDVSFKLKRGESLGIIGPNGAGKSTMLKLLSRIIKPNRGTYQVNGRLSALIEVGAGFHGDLTGRENIYLNGAILGMTRREIKAKEGMIIDFSGIEDFIDTPVKRYSSGMTARLGFAVAAHMEPDVLLVDEVLSVGDARFRQKCIQHMEKLIRSDVSVVFISHILDQVQALCPVTMVLDHGKSVYHGPTDGAIRKYMDILSDDGEVQGDQAAAVAELRKITIPGTDDATVPVWQARRPGVIECELIAHQPVEKLRIQVHFASLGGVYLGTASCPPKDVDQGTHTVRFTLDPMPLNNGDYSLTFSLFGGDLGKGSLWELTQPRTVSVKGGFAGSLVMFNGQWETNKLELTAGSTPPALATAKEGTS